MGKWNVGLELSSACKQPNDEFHNILASIMAVGTKSPLASFLHQQAEKWTGHQVVVWRCDKGEIEFSCDTLHAHFDQGGPKPHTYFSKGGYTYGLCVIIDGTFQYINSSMTKDK